MNAKIVVEVKGLCKSFHRKEVVRNCHMQVEKGTIYGFLGPNGAGKTTVFKMLMGLLKPSMGEANILGMDVSVENTGILKKVGSLIESPIFYEHLSAEENLQMHLAYMGMKTGEIKETLDIVGLAGISNQPVAEFSLGMRQRLGIARAMIHGPELLILDEPINGLDPMGIKEMRHLFRWLVTDKGMTILLSSHILSEIEQTADKIGVIKEGTVVKERMMTEMDHENLESYFLSIMNGGH